MDKSLQSAKLSYNNDHDRDDQDHLSQELMDDSDQAPSLCDLPLEASDEASKPQEENEAIKHEDDFEFESFYGLDSIHMCVADDIFLDGHILPLQHSISSNSRSISRSESMDHVSVSSSWFRSSSYTSSSSRNSSTGSRIINPFHSYPSPSPKIRAGPGTRSVPNLGPKKQTSRLWEFLRTGLVRAPPDIVKARCGSGYPTGPTISRSRSCGSAVKTMKRTPPPPMPEGGGGVFGGCKFSVWAAEPVALNKRVLNGKWRRGDNGMSVTAFGHRHRTFEWLKDVTGVGVLDSV